MIACIVTKGADRHDVIDNSIKKKILIKKDFCHPLVEMEEIPKNKRREVSGEYN